MPSLINATLKNTLIKLTGTERERAEQFAWLLMQRDKRADYYYSARKADPDYLRQQIEIGALAEIAVARYLDIDPPSLIVNSAEERAAIGYDADLINGDQRIHVKSCRADSTFPESYVFQLSDPLIDGYTDSDLLVCVRVNLTQHLAQIRVCCSFGMVRRFLRQPLSPKLIDTKLCLYFDDLFAA